MATSSEDKDRPDEDAPSEEAGAKDISTEEDGGSRAAPPAEAAAPARASRPAKQAGAARRPAGKKPGARPRAAAQPQGGSLGKSMILFLIIIGGLAAAFAYFGREPAAGTAGPKWKTGDKAQVEVTLVSTDIKDLACWSADEVNGRHCAFESPSKGWSKGDADDKKLLRPYTTTDRVQFLAAGLWSEPALTGKLPSARFALKCTYTVEGRMKRPGIRWSSEGAWLDRTDDWYTGLLSDCKLITP
ncbi:hypothetical protein BE17_34360 [Sorangium cellulosum]|uniref:Uncharacterized protein n=1 Tax=Sorangium cellulosum TaxID=56 RepID=A0A150RS88_SORCE|nr:hypothetical protein BE17_34360 [Sorangium cellulosum]